MPDGDQHHHIVQGWDIAQKVLRTAYTEDCTAFSNALYTGHMPCTDRKQQPSLPIAFKQG